MRVSILIPTKNEPFINTLIERVHGVLRDVDHEIIVIDKSDAPPKTTNAKFIPQKSNGLGKAVLEGLEHAKGGIIVTMDGDGSHRPEDVKKLLENINGYDIVIGSRFVSGGITKDPSHRKFISYIFRKFASFVLSLDVEDSMSGFIAVKRKVYDILEINPVGYKINMEILYKGRKKGYKIDEVPIIFEKRKIGKSKASIKEAFRIIRYVFELKLGLR